MLAKKTELSIGIFLHNDEKTAEKLKVFFSKLELDNIFAMTMNNGNIIIHVPTTLGMGPMESRQRKIRILCRGHIRYGLQGIGSHGSRERLAIGAATALV